ncbi:cadherin 86C [Leptinotarsa decemlineata]|uniref:cadherin 86C n=1 Tax=Leptinotarsa decemlineata TaxID=7539 RepID=UPI003D3081D0
MRWLLFAFGPLLVASVPRFDPSALLKNVLVPADAAVGSVIYRLRASDPPTFDYPLVFSVVGNSNTLDVTGLNCSKFNSVCQANVVLKKRLEPGRFYDFTVEVRNQRGEFTSLNCSFRATNATTPIEKIFPGAPSLLTISESSRRNTEIGTILAKGKPSGPRSVLLELWGSPEFGLRQRLVSENDAEGTILLLNSLDYEKKTVHHVTIYANDPWTNTEEDTRNIAGWPLLVAVLDEQDTPPIFTIAPPTTTLSPSLVPGDTILRVQAEDGDRGNPRDIRYELVQEEENPYLSFFDIDENTGELRLVRPLTDILSISHTGQPILINVTASEVRSNSDEGPAQFSTVQLALIPPGVTAELPTFGSIEYNVLLDENSPPGTELDLLQAEVNVQPGNVVKLELVNNNGTFEISPTVMESSSKFSIRVHDPKLLDYESRHSVECYIVAKGVGVANYSTRAKLTVLLNDINDNPPKFTQEEYHANVQEHANVGTNVLVVEAVDSDREPGSKIKYTRLTGEGSDLFELNVDTGLVTVADSERLDADIASTIVLNVEATDENGQGLTATSTIIITLIDINDNTPQFEKSVYEFILNKDKTNFTTPAFIKATDRDISPPNNELNYEIINNPSNLYLNQKIGELLVTKALEINDVTIFTGRVWDGGVPRLSSECEIRIYPPDGWVRKMIFIVSGRNPDRAAILETLETLTGGRVNIERIRPYTGDEPGATYVKLSEDNGDRSVVEASVTFSKDSVVDLNEINKIIVSKNEQNQVKEKEIIRIKESSSGSLLWLLILFFILLIIAALALILCCLCRQCPLYHYFYYKKRKESPVIEKIEKIKIIGSGQGRESKSVQVAEWFGRKEAWSPEQVDNEAESLRRHEMERGSDRGAGKRSLNRQSQVQAEPFRDQFYTREGNADILRLITRGGESQIPVTLVADQTYMADSGKDILMRRFMEHQQTEAARSQMNLPNSVNRLQTEHELLEASLRQQNALLRQILLERERDLRLETQSLPAGTQTDKNAGTQTEPEYLRPPRRKVRSDNDQSEASDEEDEIAAIKASTRRRHPQKSHIRRKIKTPIQEEVELEITESPKIEKKAKYKQTKTSELRQKRASSETRSSQSRSSKSGLRKEVLEEISASLEQSDESESEERYYQKRDVFSDDSLEISPRSEKTSSNSTKQRYHSESDLRLISAQSEKRLFQSKSKAKLKSRSQLDLSKASSEKKQSKPGGKVRGSRYMEWYNKKPVVERVTTKKSTGTKKKEKPNEKDDSKSTDAKPTGVKPAVSSRLLMDTESSARKKVETKKTALGPEHPLVQHSERRFEVQYPPVQDQQVRRPEEDNDSGIALTRPPMAQKKSVFTIAYDDMHTNQLRTDSITSP